ncbi:hypothetical protein ACFFX0_29120 [Citricoccus parietis]|uniref:Uncharacterized protein n=1 Tax=Citricoccus parietis TaxID=592307 RepID=A0ABV5G7T7_9MICC
MPRRPRSTPPPCRGPAPRRSGWSTPARERGPRPWSPPVTAGSAW